MNDVKRFEPLWGSWYVKELIGEGGYGKVYRAEREDFGEVYTSAVKYIKVPKSQSEVKSVLAETMDEEGAERYFSDFVGSLVKEIKLMSKVKGSSNIVSYEDHIVLKTEGKTEWNIFIRMELLTGLLDYVRNNKITRRDVIKMGIDLCRALEVCQKHNIIHRDIKPENIFVSDNGDFKLGDFGIARQIEKTAAGLSKKGTFSYMAPEVYLGRAYGSNVDIYSLGVVMYRFLNNNRTPFLPPYPENISGSDREKALSRRMSGEQFEKPVHADGRLAEIVMKACAYDPKERYESPAEMRHALEAILYSKKEAAEIYGKGGDEVRNDSVHFTSKTTGTSRNDNINKKEARREENKTVDIKEREKSHKEAENTTEKQKPESVKPVINQEKTKLTVKPQEDNRSVSFLKVGLAGALAAAVIFIIIFAARFGKTNSTEAETADYTETETEVSTETETEEAEAEESVSEIKTLYLDSGVYVGETYNDHPQGTGTMTYTNGDVYEGEWKFNNRISYPHGTGKMTFANGDIYEGEFWLGGQNGTGTMIYSDGGVYEGEWYGNLRSRTGTMTYSDGSVYEGEWYSDLRKGTGKMTFANGDTYEGEWKNDLPDGSAVYTWTSGAVFEGVWVDGHMNGYGTYTAPDGTVTTGTWENDEYIG